MGEPSSQIQKLRGERGKICSLQIARPLLGVGVSFSCLVVFLPQDKALQLICPLEREDRHLPVLGAEKAGREISVKQKPRAESSLMSEEGEMGRAG